MSRVAKIPVVLGKGVEAKIENGFITVKGPKGTLSQKLNPVVEVTIDNGEVHFKAIEPTKFSNAMSGTLRALVNSMNIGVTEGFKKQLEINGIGYRAAKQGKQIVLNVGYSHQVFVDETDDISLELVDPNHINVVGCDKQKVGQFAAEIREKRPPEPYKGKGIKYADEVIRRKVGKTGAKK